jgi:hypothetical protein
MTSVVGADVVSGAVPTSCGVGENLNLHLNRAHRLRTNGLSLAGVTAVGVLLVVAGIDGTVETSTGGTVVVVSKNSGSFTGCPLMGLNRRLS